MAGTSTVSCCRSGGSPSGMRRRARAAPTASLGGSPRHFGVHRRRVIAACWIGSQPWDRLERRLCGVGNRCVGFVFASGAACRFRWADWWAAASSACTAASFAATSATLPASGEVLRTWSSARQTVAAPSPSETPANSPQPRWRACTLRPWRTAPNARSVPCQRRASPCAITLRPPVAMPTRSRPGIRWWSCRLQHRHQRWHRGRANRWPPACSPDTPLRG